jgi:CRP-like cAMP-binding protein
MQHLLEDGRKTIAAFFMQGDIIDLRGIADRHRGQLVALGKTKICRLLPEVFNDIFDKNPNAQRIVWDNLREQTYRAIDHSADLAKKHALEKLASFIFEGRRRQIVSIAENLVTIPVRRVDLAEYLGMQPETVSRCFKDLEMRGIVKLNTISNLKILKIPTLRRIANGDRHADDAAHNDRKKFKVLSFG